MPFWLICSPSHIIRAVPAVKAEDDKSPEKTCCQPSLHGMRVALPLTVAAVSQVEVVSGALDQPENHGDIAGDGGDLFAALLSPSFAIRSSGGIATVSSCIIMELLIYGVIPIANRVAFAKAPPESISKYPAPCRPIRLTPSDPAEHLRSETGPE